MFYAYFFYILHLIVYLQIQSNIIYHTEVLVTKQKRRRENKGPSAIGVLSIMVPTLKKLLIVLEK